MTFGATRYVAKDADGDRTNPQTSLKLFTSYNLPFMPDLTVGGGINWQNRTYKEATNPSGGVAFNEPRNYSVSVNYSF